MNRQAPLSCKKPRRSISLPRNAVEPVKARAAIATPKVVNRPQPKALTLTNTRPFGICNNSTPKPGRPSIVESTRSISRQSVYLTNNAVQPVKARAAIATPKIYNRAQPKALTPTNTRPFGICNNSTPKPGRPSIVESTRSISRQSVYLTNMRNGRSGMSFTGISPVLPTKHKTKPLACKPNTKVETNDSEPSDATFCLNDTYEIEPSLRKDVSGDEEKIPKPSETTHRLDETYCLNETFDIEPASAKRPANSQDDVDSYQPSDATFQLDKTYCLNDTYDV
ncbi:hypothetical protein DdX_00531 [Ditylenchus destructor]|uniref:Uncharacterized protein n=1 Tax=Ditylenchus destructor TaxID=166010 RepID=A0AAD4RAF9_9BILA|nr:hypothetical protein DdX_00531 [Ditylenchus destructor]